MEINETTNKWIIALRAMLICLCIAIVGFIFSNSLQEAQESAKQSSQVVEIVQDVVEVVNPQSPIVTATGEDYDRLHAVIRKLAHFSEFALLGAMLCFTYFSFCREKKGVYLPALVFLGVACVDECLQLFVQGRGASILDVGLDCLGGGFGISFAFLLFWGIEKIVKKKREK